MKADSAVPVFVYGYLGRRNENEDEAERKGVSMVIYEKKNKSTHSSG